MSMSIYSTNSEPATLTYTSFRHFDANGMVVDFRISVDPKFTYYLECKIVEKGVEWAYQLRQTIDRIVASMSSSTVGVTFHVDDTYVAINDEGIVTFVFRDKAHHDELIEAEAA